jgi:hypothetical protein
MVIQTGRPAMARGAGLGSDQPQCAAGLHCRQLLVITQQTHCRAACDGDRYQLIQQEGARHASFIDEDHVAAVRDERTQVGEDGCPGAELVGGRTA